MDPISIAIVGALSAGALKGAEQVGQHFVADAYAGLKNLIIRKFGQQSEVVKAVDSLEAHPNSPGRQQTLNEEVIAAKADEDTEIVQAAQALIERIKAESGGDTHIQSAVGSYIAMADRQSKAEVHVNQPNAPNG